MISKPIFRAPERRCSASVVTLAAAFLLTAPALAQDAAVSAEGGRTIIVVGQGANTDAQERVRSTPGGADVVGHEDYADKSPVSLRDALAYSPGVYLQPRYGQEVRISIRGSGISRGFHMRGLTLLQDGIPINLADDNGDFQELEPIFFDHLEVYRGANALRFGSGTLGGAVNGATPTGRDAPDLYVRVDAGSFETLRGLASIGGTAGRGDYWAAVSADTSEGDRQHARRDSLRFHGNIGLQISDRLKTRFYASLNHIGQEIPGALPLSIVLTEPRTGNFTGDQARNVDSLRFQNRSTFVFGGGELDVGLFWNDKSLYHPIFQVVDQESRDRGAYARLNWAGGAFELTIGGEARFGKVKSRRFVNLNGKRGALTFEADQKAQTASVYGEIRFRPTGRLSLTLGGIYADGRRRQHELFSSSAGGTRDVRARADFNEFSPKFGVLFEPTAHVQIYANYSRSAEFPGFIELAQLSQFVPVDAQTAWTAEIGSRGQIGIASWDISFYRAEIDSELLQFNLGQDVPASTFNADETRHQGVEVAVSLQPTDWLRLRQVYQYSDFRFRNDRQYGGNRLPVVPKHVYRAELRLGTEALHVAPSIEWVPKGPWADYDNTLDTGGYALIGLTAGARVSDSIDLFLDARNITGERAVGDISAVIAATPNSVIFYPVERRALFGGLRARF